MSRLPSCKTVEVTVNAPLRLDIDIRALSVQDGAAFERAKLSVPADNPHFFQWLEPGMGLYDYVARLDDRRAGRHLRAHEVPSSLLFAFFGSALVGRYSFRPHLTPELEAYAGHVGYGVLPEYRRMGVATRLLKHAMAHGAKTYNIEHLIVTCDEGNLASQGVITKCGGQYLDTYTGPLSLHAKRRYRMPG